MAQTERKSAEHVSGRRSPSGGGARCRAEHPPAKRSHVRCGHDDPRADQGACGSGGRGCRGPGAAPQRGSQRRPGRLGAGRCTHRRTSGTGRAPTDQCPCFHGAATPCNGICAGQSRRQQVSAAPPALTAAARRPNIPSSSLLLLLPAQRQSCLLRVALKPPTMAGCATMGDGDLAGAGAASRQRWVRRSRLLPTSACSCSNTLHRSPEDEHRRRSQQRQQQQRARRAHPGGGGACKAGGGCGRASGGGGTGPLQRECLPLPTDPSRAQPLLG